MLYILPTDEVADGTFVCLAYCCLPRAGNCYVINHLASLCDMIFKYL